jgi:hypothetical protein
VGKQMAYPPDFFNFRRISMKTYEDKYLRNRIQTIIQIQKTGKLLVDSCKSGIGLPTKDELGAALNRASYPHDFHVGNLGYLDYERDSGMYIFIAKPDSELPTVLKGYQPFVLAEATINVATKRIQIHCEGQSIIFTAAPVWETGYNLLREINEELTRQNAAVVVWRLVWENEEFSTGLFAGPVPRLGNAHALVSLTGFAQDPDSHALVYCGCVGYKTSIESIRATLITNKPLTLVDRTVLPMDRYEVIWHAMPEYTSHHACFVARTALPGKWEPEDEAAYLLVFKGNENPKQELQHQFIDRLIETLEIPVVETWAETLWNAAVQNQFISELETAGDCILGARLSLKSDWQGLVEKLLLDGELILV